MPEVRGSDHCPISLELKEQSPLPPHSPPQLSSKKRKRERTIVSFFKTVQRAAAGEGEREQANGSQDRRTEGVSTAPTGPVHVRAAPPVTSQGGKRKQPEPKAKGSGSRRGKPQDDGKQRNLLSFFSKSTVKAEEEDPTCKKQRTADASDKATVP